MDANPRSGRARAGVQRLAGRANWWAPRQLARCQAVRLSTSPADWVNAVIPVRRRRAPAGSGRASRRVICGRPRRPGPARSRRRPCPIAPVAAHGRIDVAVDLRHFRLQDALPTAVAADLFVPSSLGDGPAAHGAEHPLDRFAHQGLSSCALRLENAEVYRLGDDDRCAPPPRRPT